VAAPPCPGVAAGTDGSRQTGVINTNEIFCWFSVSGLLAYDRETWSSAPEIAGDRREPSHSTSVRAGSGFGARPVSSTSFRRLSSAWLSVLEGA